MPHKPLAVSDNFYTPETRDNLYADVISELDASIGEVLDKLEALHLDRRTLVIFTSDNGPWYGGSTGGLRGMKGRTWEGGIRVPMIARLPGVIPAGIVNDAPSATIDLLPTICSLCGVDVPTDRVIDGKDIRALCQDAGAKSPHRAIFSMQGTALSAIRSGRWKLHVRSPGPPRFHNLARAELENWVDPRGPDGVTILAPFEQAKPTQHPGLISGDDPKAMMLFDLEEDPGEQHDLAAEYPDQVERLLTLFREVEQQVPEFPPPESDYLFESSGERVLMRLIGGDLRYDRVPRSQQDLMIYSPAAK